MCVCMPRRHQAFRPVKYSIQNNMVKNTDPHVEAGSSQCPWPVVTFWPHGTVVGLTGYWLYILPAGSPGSYSLSHTGDAYLGLHSLNGEGLNITPSLQSQVCTEDSCRVDLNAVNPATQNPWIATLSLAPLTPPQIPSWLYLWPHQILPQHKQTQADPSLLCTTSPEELIASLERSNVSLFYCTSLNSYTLT